MVCVLTMKRNSTPSAHRYTMQSTDTGGNSTKKSICNKCKRETDEESPFEEFLQNTSITAVSAVIRQRRWLAKILWLILTLVSLVMASFQSVGLIKDFMQNKVRESSVYVTQQFPPFPSITVCDINPVNWKYMETSNHTIYRQIISIDKMDVEAITMTLIRELLRLSPAERQFLYNQSTPFKPRAVLPPSNDSPIQISFRDLYLGQCTTFFPEDELTIQDLMGNCNHFAMHITVPINLEERIPKLHPSKVAYVIIHPRGSPPAFRLEKTIRIKPFDKITIKLDQFLTVIDEDHRNKNPQLTCIENHKAVPTSLKSGTIFDEPGKRKYGYTKIGCVYEAVQKLQYEQGCVDVITPLENMLVADVDNLTLCTDDNLLPFSPNECPSLCEELEVTYTVSRWSKILDEQIHDRIRMNKLRPMDDQMVSTIDEEMEGEFNSSTIDALVTIYQTKGYRKTVKTALSSFADVVGMIGGNVGLWLGISMLSIWEIIELGCALITKKLRRQMPQINPDTTTHSHDSNSSAISITHVLEKHDEKHQIQKT